MNGLAVKALLHLKQEILNRNEWLDAHVHRTSFHNPWMVREHYRRRLMSVAEHLLQADHLSSWQEKYQFPIEPEYGKKVGIVFDGKIPLESFEDFVGVYLSGHPMMIRLSPDDPYVFPAILKILEEADPTISETAVIVEKMKDFEAIIVSGTRETLPHLRKYFGQYPAVIKRRRKAVAVLDGEETEEELALLCGDVFEFFGMGTKNVSKLYVPEGYDFGPLLKKAERYADYANHHRYKNNFDYFLSRDILDHAKVISTGFLALKPEAERIEAPVGTLYFREYKNGEEAAEELSARAAEITAVVGRHPVEGIPHLDFGAGRRPELPDVTQETDLGHFLFSLACDL